MATRSCSGRNKLKRVYVDMDGVLCDYVAKFTELRNEGNKFPQQSFDFFRSMKPMPSALAAMGILSKHFDVWILTKPSYKNPMSYTEKRLWVEDHLGLDWCKKLILCPDKGLVIGDYLIDDFLWPEFQGEQVHFGSNRFPNWRSVIDYMRP